MGYGPGVVNRPQLHCTQRQKSPRSGIRVPGIAACLRPPLRGQDKEDIGGHGIRTRSCESTATTLYTTPEIHAGIDLQAQGMKVSAERLRRSLARLVA